MRTTVTLDPDVEALIRRAMAAQGVSFKRALNNAIRAGLTPAPPSTRYRLHARHLGQASVPLTRALQLASELEDEEIARKLAVGK